MKFYEKNLLDSLQSQETQDIPLKNVRNAMGHIGQTVGNPLSKTEIALSVDVFFVDNMLAPVQPAALPVNLQNSLPVYIFGLTDFHGGYLRCRDIVKCNDQWMLFNPVGQPFVGIWNYNINAFAIPIFAALCQSGDMVFIYTDNVAV